MNDDSVMTLISFGGWVSLLLFALCVAGWIGDRVRDYAKKKRTSTYYWQYLDSVVADDREARAKGHLTADEVIHRSRAA